MNFVSEPVQPWGPGYNLRLSQAKDQILFKLKNMCTSNRCKSTQLSEEKRSSKKI